MAMLKWGFGLMSIVRPCETCELHGSEVLWFLDMSPVGPSIFLLPSLSAVMWSLLPRLHPLVFHPGSGKVGGGAVCMVGDPGSWNTDPPASLSSSAK